MAADRRESVVFFDMDHTLLEGPFPSQVFPRVLGEIAQKSGQEYDALLQWARQENHKRQSDPAFSAVQAMDWDDICIQLAGDVGVELQTSALDVLQAHCGPPYSVLHEGAREALEQLAAGRPRRALVLTTKGLRKYQLPILEALGLLPFFDDIITPDSGLALKQSIRFYGRWPQVTRLQIMVGDTYEDDVLPAHRFGFKTVLRSSPAEGYAWEADPFVRAHGRQDGHRGWEVRPDAIIISLSELPRVIDRLEYEALSA